MNSITLSWEDWRAVIAVLREKALPSMREHADHIERLLDRHAADEPMVTLSLTDDVFLRSSTWARWQLRIPLSVDGWSLAERPFPHRGPGREFGPSVT